MVSINRMQAAPPRYELPAHVPEGAVVVVSKHGADWRAVVVRNADGVLVAQLGYDPRKFHPPHFTTKNVGVYTDFVAKPAWQMVGGSYLLSVLTEKERDEAAISLTTAHAAWATLNAHFTAAHAAAMTFAATAVARINATAICEHAISEDEHAAADALVMLHMPFLL